MATETNPRFKLVLFLCLFLKIHFSLGADTISVGDVFSCNSTIVSASRVFEMGFFRPGSAPNYYIGIWYLQDRTHWAVWVANREKPVSFSSELRISEGNLVLFDESKVSVWSTNVTSSTSSRSVQAVLLDSGNLILNDISSPSKPLWQSFDHPTHTWLPGAKFGYNKITNTSQRFTSWKNLEDPAPGLFSFEFDAKENFLLSRWNRTIKYWSTGSWGGSDFSNYPAMKFDYIYDFSFVSNENESYFTYSRKNTYTSISHLYMDVSGQITQANWQPTSGWNTFWLFPREQCEVYAFCGAYGICSEKSSPFFCSCLMGFKPKLPSYWDLKDYSGGCIRRTKLQCETNGSTRVSGRERDRFLAMHIMPLPENKHFVKTARSFVECKSRCLSNCSCTAYAYDSIGCSIWTGELMNLVQLSEGDSSLRTVYIRLTASDFHERSLRNWKLYFLLPGIMAAAMFTGCSAFFVYYLRRKKSAGRKGNSRIIQLVSSDDSERHITDCLIPSGSGRLREEEKKGIHVPFVALESILVATDNFSEANKLGQGGFGSVYKGKFPHGQELALKRLSSCSGQGLREFKNEVFLIAKLQHRNLVRLLGYCVEGNEQILLYEYMPNKSLDSFLFDQKLCIVLNWKIRLNIILGIARGLVYLHHDSRLRIIHRDLKTSNILLDEEMNPKISDFGLARIFGGKQIEANTNRVVGTYGYMSPEYALEGSFSIKSDVFSFGVVMLEIISGKRNTEFYDSKHALSLLGYAWKLWKEDNALDLMDSTLRNNCNENELLRCVNIGLLCVQDDPSHRPTTSNVVVMLGSETGSLPSPRQPAFVVKRDLSSKASLEPSSNNRLTDSLYQGR